MALDDFDDIDDEKAAAQSRVDGIDANDPLNEDLFDFAGPKAPATPAASSPSVEPRSPLPQAAPTESHTRPAQLLTPEPSAAPRPSSSIDHTLSPTATSSPFHDPLLDVDLFAFPTLFVGCDEVESAAAARAQILEEEAADDESESHPTALAAAVASVPQSDAPRAKATPEARPEAARAAVAPAVAPAARARERTRAADVAEPEKSALEEVILRMPNVPGALPAPARGRVLELLALLFVLVNTGLVLFAWQANSSFHATLTEVTRAVSETLASQARVGAAAPMQATPLPEAGTPALAFESLDQPPNLVAGLQLQSIELARRMLAEGRYIDARIGLYRLLANADAAGIDPHLVTESEYLIAESYELQGRALAERE